MGETSNYKLYVTDDATERFQDWRRQMNGPDSSNMTKIDTALSEKADKSRTVEAVLSAAQWTGDAAPFQQTVAVAGMTADQNGTISLAHGATDAQVEAAKDATLSVTGQAEGTITVSAGHTKPTIDLPVVVVLID